MRRENNIAHPFLWLASYPRSGNTLLRTILWHCFGLRSASVYRDDLGGNRLLEEHVGHIAYGPRGQVLLRQNEPLLLKTHERPVDHRPAIYVLRDGRAASVSLWRFYSGKGDIPLASVIAGRHRYGTWSDHISNWRPWERPNTLLLKYEDMADDLPRVLRALSAFLKREPSGNRLPDRQALAGIDGRWVGRKTDWRSQMPPDLLAQFHARNGKMMMSMGYPVE